MSERIRLLLIEDDRIQRQLLAERMEEAADMDLLAWAADGAEGLALARELSPDVIVLDLILPKMDGLELLRRYRSGGGKADVLVLTRAGGAGITAMALATGADYVLVKPAPWEEIARRIRTLSGGLTRLCEALLLDMGAKGKWLGTSQAARCAGALGEKRCAILKEAYAEVSARDRCGMETVEKNIRDLVKRLRELNSPLYKRLFAEERPSNGDFLRLLAHYALLGDG